MTHVTDTSSAYENHRHEQRRGCLALAVLGALRAEQYGYSLRKILADRGMAIDENTLYPLLRRLETQGLLVSEWREEDKRNKRFYRLSHDGTLVLKQLLADWQSINTSLSAVL
jgi:PadR family transcriptional regulator PadR